MRPVLPMPMAVDAQLPPFDLLRRIGLLSQRPTSHHTRALAHQRSSLRSLTRTPLRAAVRRADGHEARVAALASGGGSVRLVRRARRSALTRSRSHQLLRAARPISLASSRRSSRLLRVHLQLVCA
jgi:hypothetical protein